MINNPQYLQQYSIQTLERVYKHYYFIIRGYDVTEKADLTGYADSAAISGYAVEAMQWANANGIVNGMTATTLAPQGTATRAQVATMLMNFCENVVTKAE